MTQVMNIVNQLRMNGEELPDQKVVEKVLRTLPKKFDAMVVAIEESKDLTQLSVDELLGSLVSHESRINRNDIDANYSNTFENYEDSLFLTCNASQETSNDIWLIDSGCSNHMTGNRSLIANLDDLVRTEVKLGTKIL
jgi:hypothetical protein